MHDLMIFQHFGTPPTDAWVGGAWCATGGASHVATPTTLCSLGHLTLNYQVPVKIVGDHVVFGSSFDQKFGKATAILSLDAGTRGGGRCVTAAIKDNFG